MSPCPPAPALSSCSLTFHPNRGVWQVHSLSRVQFPFPLKCHLRVTHAGSKLCSQHTGGSPPLSGLTQKPGAGLCRPYSSPEDDSRPGQGFCAAARMGQRGRAVAVEPGPRGTNHVHFCKTALALRGAWILLKANSPVSRSLGKACCRAPL